MRRSFCVFVDQRKQMTDGTARGTMKEYVRVVQHTYEDSAEVAEGFGGSTAGICSEPLLFCSTDRRDG